MDLKRELKSIGLEMAPVKCKAFSASTIHPRVKALLERSGLSEKAGSFPANGIELLGTPVGPTPDWDVSQPLAFEDAEVVRAVLARADVVDRVACIRDPVALCLLTRYCLSTRHNYHVRTVDPVSGARGAELHDEQVERLIALCIGVDLEDARVDGPVKWALRQAGLPSSEGGFGAVPARTVRHAAYYGSCVLALRQVGSDRHRKTEDAEVQIQIQA